MSELEDLLRRLNSMQDGHREAIRILDGSQDRPEHIGKTGKLLVAGKDARIRDAKAKLVDTGIADAGVEVDLVVKLAHDRGRVEGFLAEMIVRLARQDEVDAAFENQPGDDGLWANRGYILALAGMKRGEPPVKAAAPQPKPADPPQDTKRGKGWQKGLGGLAALLQPTPETSPEVSVESVKDEAVTPPVIAGLPAIFNPIPVLEGELLDPPAKPRPEPLPEVIILGPPQDEPTAVEEVFSAEEAPPALEEVTAEEVSPEPQPDAVEPEVAVKPWGERVARAFAGKPTTLKAPGEVQERLAVLRAKLGCTAPEEPSNFHPATVSSEEVARLQRIDLEEAIASSRVA